MPAHMPRTHRFVRGSYVGGMIPTCWGYACKVNAAGARVRVSRTVWVFE